MVNMKLCKEVRVAGFLFASFRHFDFSNCETEMLKHFKCSRHSYVIYENKQTSDFKTFLALQKNQDHETAL